MARPGNYPLDLYHGDSYNWQFLIWEDDAKTLPADLTGVVAKSQIRNAPGGATIVDLDVTVTLPNMVEMALPATLWPDFGTIKIGAWDLQLTYPDASVITVLAGKVTVTMDVTDSDPALRATVPTRSTVRVVAS